jgi:hypothetical protein
VHLDRVDAVLEDVLGGDDLSRQLARLARPRATAASPAIAASQAAGSSSSGVMSRNMIPGLG